MILERLLYKNFRILLLEAAHAYFPNGLFLDILETVINASCFCQLVNCESVHYEEDQQNGQESVLPDALWYFSPSSQLIHISTVKGNNHHLYKSHVGFTVKVVVVYRWHSIACKNRNFVSGFFSTYRLTLRKCQRKFKCSYE